MLLAFRLSLLFNRSHEAMTMAALHEAAATAIRDKIPWPAVSPILAALPNSSGLKSPISNENLVVFDAASRDAFLLHRHQAPVRMEWLIREVFERYVDRCDWLLLTEDDTYLDLDILANHV